MLLLLFPAAFSQAASDGYAGPDPFTRKLRVKLDDDELLLLIADLI